MMAIDLLIIPSKLDQKCFPRLAITISIICVFCWASPINDLSFVAVAIHWMGVVQCFYYDWFFLSILWILDLFMLWTRFFRAFGGQDFLILHTTWMRFDLSCLRQRLCARAILQMKTKPTAVCDTIQILYLLIHFSVCLWNYCGTFSVCRKTHFALWRFFSPSGNQIISTILNE